ncbi:MAG: ATP-dependent DNA helicase PcrA [Ruminococcaceae bacterium]|nr:ATP-dependent DNA helicase PcrA [Oscillospiraceae bacterium]
MLSENRQKQYIKMRRELISREFSKLNSMQRSAVLHTEGPLLVLAGAGSGKTTVLVNRVANILRYGKAAQSERVPSYVGDDEFMLLEGYYTGQTKLSEEEKQYLLGLDVPKPYNVLAITFTNKAAGEMRERLDKMMGEGALDMWACTFHSMCVRILHREIERLGFKKDFTIYDTDDSQRVLKSILKDFDLDDKNMSPKMIHSVIGRAKDSMLSPERFAEINGREYRMGTIAKVYEEYQKRLKAANALDFDDLIYFTVKLFSECEEVREYYSRRFKYILVDEYQDTSRAQHKLVKLLTGEQCNICVVGDDDQSIYSFRGAVVENILGFDGDFDGVKVIRLEQNYRSTQNILDAANAIISKNSSRHEKKLWTENEKGEKITFYEAENNMGEESFIADTIFDGVAEQGRRYSDYAILYRVNAQGNSIEKALARMSIPYRIIGGTRFYERKEIKDAVAYLSVVHNTADNVRLRRIINEPARGIGATSIDKVEGIANSIDTSMMAVMRTASDFPELSRTSSKLTAFADMIDSLREKAKEMTLGELFAELLEKTGYITSLIAENSPESKERIDNLNELRSNMIGYEQETAETGLPRFLEEIALFSSIDNYDADSDAVVLMTIHSAKGLEFPVVFIPGMEDGLFPSMQSVSEKEGVEEERRLAYVAFTRAKEKLYVIYADERLLFGSTTYQKRSRFLEDVPGYVVDMPRKKRAKRRGEAMFDDYASGFDFTYSQTRPKTQSELYESQLPKKQPKVQSVAFEVGDRVMHKAFGQGFILSVKPMGSDAMLEVAFDNSGTKKLMANYAKLEKI